MKKTSLLLSTLAVILSACGGGSGNSNSVQNVQGEGETESLKPQKEIHVSTAEEFINAIGNDTHIILDDNILDLQSIVDLKVQNGKISKVEYENEDYRKPIKQDNAVVAYGYGSYSNNQLNFMSLNNFTIDGGKDRYCICLDSYEADVLSFVFCKNITIKNIILGHEPTAGCAGGVTKFFECSNVTIENSQLFGCGEIGIDATKCNNFTVSKSDIFDCSYAGIEVNDISNFAFNNCNFADLDTDVLNFWEDCKDVVFNNCVFDVENYETNNPNANKITYNNCKVDTSLNFPDLWSELVGGFGYDGYYEGEEFEYYGDNPDEGPDPVELEFDDVKGSFSDKVIHVKTGQEFIKALGNNRTIIVDNDILDFSYCLGDLIDNGEISQESEGKPAIPGIYCTDNFDGWGLKLSHIYNLKIEGKNKETHIQIEPKYADVLYFEFAKNIELKNLKLGHKEKGDCEGAVLHFNSCQDIEIEDCKLYGCGVQGIFAAYCNNIDVEDTEIYECSETGLYYNVVKQSKCKNCKFYQLANPLILTNSYVTFKKCSFDVEYWNPDYTNNGSKDNPVVFDNCDIKYKNVMEYGD
ncbi:MAG: right-handed parallel beta-helix repeat-containing protein [Bacteroidales bacterium]|nr:right-handed parallel beta-helix repeat-containing protein [Bacteroidales bacterium]